MTSNPSPVWTLPTRPSLESLRKQAKTLARQIAAGDTLQRCASVEFSGRTFLSDVANIGAPTISIREG